MNTSGVNTVENILLFAARRLPSCTADRDGLHCRTEMWISAKKNTPQESRCILTTTD